MKRSCFLMLILAASASDVAVGHEVRPAYLQLRQVSANEFDVLWKVPARGELRLALSLVLPEEHEVLTEPTVYPLGDAHLQQQRIRFRDGLEGKKLSIEGLTSTLTDALVRCEWLDGRVFTTRLNAGDSSFTVPETPDGWQAMAAYLWMGVEHILLGIDHLLFVLGLLLLVRSGPTLVKTITAFTIAHSCSLRQVP